LKILAISPKPLLGSWSSKKNSAPPALLFAKNMLPLRLILPADMA
jgi:hypothetical protein